MTCIEIKGAEARGMVGRLAWLGRLGRISPRVHETARRPEHASWSPTKKGAKVRVYGRAGRLAKRLVVFLATE